MQKIGLLLSAAGCNDFVRKLRTEVIFEKMALHLGVCYLYGSPQLRSGGAENLSLPQSILQPNELREALSLMPADWVEQLHQAATKVNAKQILKLRAQIPAPNAHLANSLTHLVNNFYFEEIVKLTQQQTVTRSVRNGCPHLINFMSRQLHLSRQGW